MNKILLHTIWFSLNVANAYWDLGTTTAVYVRSDTIPRQSFFRWQITHNRGLKFWFKRWDWATIEMNRRLNSVCGISIDFLPLSTAVILNRRILISAANYLAPYWNRQEYLRIWSLGRTGKHITPYRYRVWKVRRLLPRTENPEHMHGPRGTHIPRHDISLIFSLDMMYIYYMPPHRFMYPYKALLCDKRTTLTNDLWFTGSGYEYLQHIKENYKIFWGRLLKENVVNCERFLPKYWGKFICIKNHLGLPGVQNGGGMFTGLFLVGMGCFEIRYNEERIFVFTDLRYYIDLIYIVGSIFPGEYYEYAYPQWCVWQKGLYDQHGNTPTLPYRNYNRYIDTLYPLGKRK